LPNEQLQNGSSSFPSFAAPRLTVGGSNACPQRIEPKIARMQGHERSLQNMENVLILMTTAEILKMWNV
jgi:hypothetical protein